MLLARRLAKPLLTGLCGGLVAFALASAAAGGDAHAQISGTIGGDVVEPPPLMEPDGIGWLPASGATVVPADALKEALTDGTSNTVIFAESVRFNDAGRVAIAAEVEATDAAGNVRTNRIIAVLIGLFAPRAPGFMDYTDDSCMGDRAAAPAPAELHACALVGHAFRDLVQARRLAVAPTALMLHVSRGLAIWDPR